MTVQCCFACSTQESETALFTRELRVGGGVLAEALGAGLTADAEGFAADLDFAGSALAGAGAGVRVGR